MTQPSQRCSDFAATLARLVLLVFALFLTSSCRSDPTPIAPDAASAAEALAPATTSAPTTSTPTTSTTNVESSTTAPPPTSTVAPGIEPQLERADLSIAADLDGLIARRTDSGDLVTSKPDGTDEVVWSLASESRVSQPTWSRDGQQLAWSSFDNDGAAVVRASIAETPDDVVEVPSATPAFYLSWSPNSEWIAGLRNGREGLELTMLDTAANELRVVGPGQPFFTDWVTGDSLIAAIAGRVLVDVPAAALGEPRQRDSASLGLFQAPVVLANGDIVVAVRDGNANAIVRIDGSTSSTIAHADGPIAMSLDPTSNRLAILVAQGQEPEFISFQTAPQLPSGAVSIVDLDTGAIETRVEENVVAVHWSPTGDSVALLEFSGTDLTWVFADPTSTDEAQRSVPFDPSPEFATAYIPFFDQYDRSTSWWSPDGKAFVFAGTAYGEAGIWIDRIDDGAGPALLGPGDIATWSS